tara:strand:+ start:8225 stop:8797 length:573 start_codon:yes stop_codon:yes gene_type:complete
MKVSAIKPLDLEAFEDVYGGVSLWEIGLCSDDLKKFVELYLTNLGKKIEGKPEFVPVKIGGEAAGFHCLFPHDSADKFLLKKYKENNYELEVDERGNELYEEKESLLFKYLYDTKDLDVAARLLEHERVERIENERIENEMYEADDPAYPYFCDIPIIGEDLKEICEVLVGKRKVEIGQSSAYRKPFGYI